MAINPTIDERKKSILTAVVEEYIKTGEPIGSHAVLNRINMSISSATVRSEMASLEKCGLLVQPHTSAGRIPTNLGYRFYIDNLMMPNQLSKEEKLLIDSLLTKEKLQTADSVVENALTVLSDLTNLAVVSKNNMPLFSIITRVEVIPAGRRLYALLIITSSGTIKNKICR
ncbi:MAG: heat-inducible transcription repressor HrcA, partial [Oscillospiraceae bacterium]